MVKSFFATRVWHLAVSPAVVAAVLVVAISSTHAQSVKLSELIQTGGSITNGDKKFDQFSYEFTGDMPDAGMVNVVPIVDDDGNLGIQFQGFFTDLFSSQGGSDALISYRVMVLDPKQWIVDAHIFGNPELLGDAGSISVTEVFTFDRNGENQMSIFDDETAGIRLADWTTFAPTQIIHVRKDIGAIASDQGSVTMSFVDQTFSQIPEPTNAVLMLIGGTTLAAAAARRRRRRA